MVAYTAGLRFSGQAPNTRTAQGSTATGLELAAIRSDSPQIPYTYTTDQQGLYIQTTTAAAHLDNLAEQPLPATTAAGGQTLANGAWAIPLVGELVPRAAANPSAAAPQVPTLCLAMTFSTPELTVGTTLPLVTWYGADGTAQLYVAFTPESHTGSLYFGRLDCHVLSGASRIDVSSTQVVLSTACVMPLVISAHRGTSQAGTQVSVWAPERDDFTTAGARSHAGHLHAPVHSIEASCAAQLRVGGAQLILPTLSLCHIGATRNTTAGQLLPEASSVVCHTVATYIAAQNATGLTAGWTQSRPAAPPDTTTSKFDVQVVLRAFARLDQSQQLYIGGQQQDIEQTVLSETATTDVVTDHGVRLSTGGYMTTALRRSAADVLGQQGHYMPSFSVGLTFTHQVRDLDVLRYEDYVEASYPILSLGAPPPEAEDTTTQSPLITLSREMLSQGEYRYQVNILRSFPYYDYARRQYTIISGVLTHNFDVRAHNGDVVTCIIRYLGQSARIQLYWATTSADGSQTTSSDETLNFRHSIGYNPNTSIVDPQLLVGPVEPAQITWREHAGAEPQAATTDPAPLDVWDVLCLDSYALSEAECAQFHAAHRPARQLADTTAPTATIVAQSGGSTCSPYDVLYVYLQDESATLDATHIVPADVSITATVAGSAQSVYAGDFSSAFSDSSLEVVSAQDTGALSSTVAANLGLSQTASGLLFSIRRQEPLPAGSTLQLTVAVTDVAGNARTVQSQVFTIVAAGTVSTHAATYYPDTGGQPLAQLGIVGVSGRYLGTVLSTPPAPLGVVTATNAGVLDGSLPPLPIGGPYRLELVPVTALNTPDDTRQTVVSEPVIVICQDTWHSRVYSLRKLLPRNWRTGAVTSALEPYSAASQEAQAADQSAPIVRILSTATVPVAGPFTLSLVDLGTGVDASSLAIDVQAPGVYGGARTSIVVAGQARVLSAPFALTTDVIGSGLAISLTPPTDLTAGGQARLFVHVADVAGNATDAVLTYQVQSGSLDTLGPAINATTLGALTASEAFSFSIVDLAGAQVTAAGVDPDTLTVTCVISGTTGAGDSTQYNCVRAGATQAGFALTHTTSHAEHQYGLTMQTGWPEESLCVMTITAADRQGNSTTRVQQFTTVTRADSVAPQIAYTTQTLAPYDTVDVTLSDTRQAASGAIVQGSGVALSSLVITVASASGSQTIYRDGAASSDYTVNITHHAASSSETYDQERIVISRQVGLPAGQDLTWTVSVQDQDGNAAQQTWTTPVTRLADTRGPTITQQLPALITTPANQFAFVVADLLDPATALDALGNPTAAAQEVSGVSWGTLYATVTITQLDGTVLPEETACAAGAAAGDYTLSRSAAGLVQLTRTTEFPESASVQVDVRCQDINHNATTARLLYTTAALEDVTPITIIDGAMPTELTPNYPIVFALYDTDRLAVRTATLEALNTSQLTVTAHITPPGQATATDHIFVSGGAAQNGAAISYGALPSASELAAGTGRVCTVSVPEATWPAGGTMTYTVDAQDLAGNVSTLTSSPRTIALDADTQAVQIVDQGTATLTGQTPVQFIVADAVPSTGTHASGVDADTIAVSVACMPGAVNFTNHVSTTLADVTYDGRAGQLVTITPDIDWPRGATVNITVSAADLANNAATHTRSFTTDAVLDQQSPAIVLNNAAFTQSTVRLAASEALSITLQDYPSIQYGQTSTTAGLDFSTFYLTLTRTDDIARDSTDMVDLFDYAGFTFDGHTADPGSMQISGNYTFLGDVTTNHAADASWSATLSRNVPWPDDAQFTLTISISDLAGNPVSTQATFLGPRYVDVVPPQITLVSAVIATTDSIYIDIADAYSDINWETLGISVTSASITGSSGVAVSATQTQHGGRVTLRRPIVGWPSDEELTIGVSIADAPEDDQAANTATAVLTVNVSALPDTGAPTIAVRPAVFDPTAAATATQAFGFDIEDTGTDARGIDYAATTATCTATYLQGPQSGTSLTVPCTVTYSPTISPTTVVVTPTTATPWPLPASLAIAVTATDLAGPANTTTQTFMFSTMSPADTSAPVFTLDTTGTPPLLPQAPLTFTLYDIDEYGAASAQASDLNLSTLTLTAAIQPLPGATTPAAQTLPLITAGAAAENFTMALSAVPATTAAQRRTLTLTPTADVWPRDASVQLSGQVADAAGNVGALVAAALTTAAASDQAAPVIAFVTPIATGHTVDSSTTYVAPAAALEWTLADTTYANSPAAERGFNLTACSVKFLCAPFANMPAEAAYATATTADLGTAVARAADTFTLDAAGIAAAAAAGFALTVTASETTQTDTAGRATISTILTCQLSRTAAYTEPHGLWSTGWAPGRALGLYVTATDATANAATATATFATDRVANRGDVRAALESSAAPTAGTALTDPIQFSFASYPSPAGISLGSESYANSRFGLNQAECYITCRRNDQPTTEAAAIIWSGTAADITTSTYVPAMTATLATSGTSVRAELTVTLVPDAPLLAEAVYTFQIHAVDIFGHTTTRTATVTMPAVDATGPTIALVPSTIYETTDPIRLTITDATGVDATTLMATAIRTGGAPRTCTLTYDATTQQYIGTPQAGGGFTAGVWVPGTYTFNVAASDTATPANTTTQSLSFAIADPDTVGPTITANYDVAVAQNADFVATFTIQDASRPLDRTTFETAVRNLADIAEITLAHTITEATPASTQAAIVAITPPAEGYGGGRTRRLIVRASDAVGNETTQTFALITAAVVDHAGPVITSLSGFTGGSGTTLPGATHSTNNTRPAVYHFADATGIDFNTLSVTATIQYWTVSGIHNGSAQSIALVTDRSTVAPGNLVSLTIDATAGRATITPTNLPLARNYSTGHWPVTANITLAVSVSDTLGNASTFTETFSTHALDDTLAPTVEDHGELLHRGALTAAENAEYFTTTSSTLAAIRQIPWDRNLTFALVNTAQTTGAAFTNIAWASINVTMTIETQTQHDGNITPTTLSLITNGVVQTFAADAGPIVLLTQDDTDAARPGYLVEIRINPYSLWPWTELNTFDRRKLSLHVTARDMHNNVCDVTRHYAYSYAPSIARVTGQTYYYVQDASTADILELAFNYRSRVPIVGEIDGQGVSALYQEVQTATTASAHWEASADNTTAVLPPITTPLTIRSAYETPSILGGWYLYPFSVAAITTTSFIDGENLLQYSFAVGGQLVDTQSYTLDTIRESPHTVDVEIASGDAPEITNYGANRRANNVALALQVHHDVGIAWPRLFVWYTTTDQTTPTYAIVQNRLRAGYTEEREIPAGWTTSQGARIFITPPTSAPWPSDGFTLHASVRSTTGMYTTYSRRIYISEPGPITITRTSAAASTSAADITLTIASTYPIEQSLLTIAADVVQGSTTTPQELITAGTASAACTYTFTDVEVTTDGAVSHVATVVLTPATGWLAPADYDITVNATDNRGTSATDAFEVNVSTATQPETTAPVQCLDPIWNRAFTWYIIADTPSVPTLDTGPDLYGNWSTLYLGQAAADAPASPLAAGVQSTAITPTTNPFTGPHGSPISPTLADTVYPRCRSFSGMGTSTGYTLPELYHFRTVLRAWSLPNGRCVFEYQNFWGSGVDFSILLRTISGSRTQFAVFGSDAAGTTQIYSSIILPVPSGQWALIDCWLEPQADGSYLPMAYCNGQTVTGTTAVHHLSSNAHNSGLFRLGVGQTITSPTLFDAGYVFIGASLAPPTLAEHTADMARLTITAD